MSASSSSQPPIEIIDTTQDEENEHNEQDDYGSEFSDGDGQDEALNVDSQTPSTSSQSKKKKKKAKAKAAKLLRSLKPGGDGKEIPQKIVDKVMEVVRKEQGDNPNINEQNVRSALEELKIMDVVKGKAGIAGRGKKDLGEHKFWSTQPVQQAGEGPPLEDGYIEPPTPHDQVRQDPFPLPNGFEWSTLDLNDDHQTREVYELLTANYIEDDKAAFRFQYTSEFLQWALKVPGYHKEWHVGVRVTSNKKLVAFIAGVPATLRVRDNVFRASEINYLCVHKKLRSKRLAPVLIKEVTRQCHLKGIFQAIYTAGVVLPTPVSTCRYYHRSLKVPKLVDIKFTYVPRNSTIARMSRLNKLPSVPLLANKGLREMRDSDVEQVKALYDKYMQRFTMMPVMTTEELRHQFLSGLGRGEVMNWRREGQVVWAYVVEDPSTNKITDFFTFYSLPSTIMQHPKHNLLEAAYMFYYATDVAFQVGADEEEDGRLKKRLMELVGDALIVADQAGFDVFNAMTLMDNVEFVKDLKFGSGDGLLNFYLYNWRTSPMAGVSEIGGVKAGRGIGVVML